VFTGGLANRSREEAGRDCEAAWRKNRRLREQEDDYVVVGTDPGSKYDKAKELGVAILDEGWIRKAGGVEVSFIAERGVEKL